MRRVPALPTTSRSFALLVAAALAASLAGVPPARADWGADPLLVHATSASCPQVAACADAAHGAIVVWQEVTSGTSGVLRAGHVTAAGAVDAAWPAPASVCATVATRPALLAVSDGSGGAYVVWMENTALYLTRLGPDGAIAAGWPARGRAMGTLWASQARPRAMSDGANGIYVLWEAANVTGLPLLDLSHLGPANTGAGGASASPHAIGATSDNAEWPVGGELGVAPDGSVWVAWATLFFDEATSSTLPGDFRLVHLGTALGPLAGWDAHGAAIGTFHGDLAFNAGQLCFGTPIAICSDGANGAFTVRQEIVGDPAPDSWVAQPLLQRHDANGANAPGWAAGVAIPLSGLALRSQPVPDGAAARAIADGQGGVYAGVPVYASEGSEGVDVRHYSGAGASLGPAPGGSQQGFEIFARGDGGLITACVNPNGPTSMWSPNAFVSGQQSAPGQGYTDFQSQPGTWYGDVGITSSDDGGAILAFSQQNGRQGVFAVKMPGLAALGVPPGRPARSHLALRAVPGDGVHAFAAFASAGPVQVELADVAGRVLAREGFTAGAGGREWRIAGSEALLPGLYFVRARAADGPLRAKVAVVR